MHERLLALMGDGRRLRARVVAAEREHTAVWRRPCIIAVLEGVARAVDTGPLAVPDAEDAVVLRAAADVRQLRAPDGGGRQILVDAGLETDLVLLEEGLRLPERQVVGTERRAAIAGDEAGRIQPRRLIALPLHHGQPHQGLDARDVDSAGLACVLVVEVVGGVERRGQLAHGGSSRGSVGGCPGCSTPIITTAGAFPW